MARSGNAAEVAAVLKGPFSGYRVFKPNGVFNPTPMVTAERRGAPSAPTFAVM
jgi:hypothetical protein